VLRGLLAFAFPLPLFSNKLYDTLGYGTACWRFCLLVQVYRVAVDRHTPALRCGVENRAAVELLGYLGQDLDTWSWLWLCFDYLCWGSLCYLESPIVPYLIHPRKPYYPNFYLASRISTRFTHFIISSAVFSIGIEPPGTLSFRAIRIRFFNFGLGAFSWARILSSPYGKGGRRGCAKGEF
jgi:hypothetical protein